MPALQIRDLDEELYQKLKDSAHRERRSLAQQAAVLIEQGLKGQDGDRNRERRGRLLERIAEEGSPALSKGLPTPAQILAEDRRR